MLKDDWCLREYGIKHTPEHATSAHLSLLHIVTVGGPGKEQQKQYLTSKHLHLLAHVLELKKGRDILHSQTI